MRSKYLARLFRAACAACALFLPSCMTEPGAEVVGEDTKAATTSFSVNASGVEVRTTALLERRNVCGRIQIRNNGDNPAELVAVADFLEVHFPRHVTPPPLPAGPRGHLFA